MGNHPTFTTANHRDLQPPFSREADQLNWLKRLGMPGWKNNSAHLPGRKNTPVPFESGVPTTAKTTSSTAPTAAFWTEPGILGMGQSSCWGCWLQPLGYESKLNHQGTAGFSPCFHLPGFHFGFPIFDPQPLCSAPPP